MATQRIPKPCSKLVAMTVLACAASALLSACGTHPSATATTPTPFPSVNDPLPMVEIPRSAAPEGTGPAGDGRSVLAQVVAAFKAIPAYEAQMTFYQKASGKTAVSGLYQLTGQAPRTLKLHIVSGGGAGSHLLWSGGKTVKVRPGGFLSALSLDLQLNDARLTSVRGYTLDQTDIPALLDGFARNKLGAPIPTPHGVVITATGLHLLAGIVSMTGTFDAQTYLPSKVEMSDGHEVVLRFVITGMHAVKATTLSI